MRRLVALRYGPLLQVVIQGLNGGAMKVLSDDTAVSRASLVGEDQVLPTPVPHGRLAGRLRRLAVFLRGHPLEKTDTAERPGAVARKDYGASHADMDAGLTRGATLLFGAGPTRPRRR